LKNSISKTVLYISYAIILLVGLLFYPKWNKGQTEATLSWDVSGYYMYLPAFFIYENPDELEWIPGIIEKYKCTPDYQQAFKHESGKYVLKYSSGLSVLMSPYFAIAHTIASLNDNYPADGFSKPYQMAIGLGMLIYAFIGLWFFRKILLEYFSETTVALSILLLVFGTNYLNFSAVDQAMTHSALFAIYALIIWNSINFYKRPSSKIAWFIGLLIGLAALTRPTEIIAILIPFLWNVNSINSFKTRSLFFLKEWKYILICAIGVVAVGSIQLFYWKYITGSWIVYSYGDQGFSWLDPHFYEYWFNPQRGWLRFCPTMFLFFIGALFVIRKKYPWVAVLIFGSLYIYITAAWDVTWYGGRAMIQSYPVLFFSIASLIEWTVSKKVMRIPFFIILAGLVYYNIWYSYHLHAGKVHTINVSHAYWKVSAGRYSVHPDAEYLLDNEDWYKENIPPERQIIFSVNTDSAFQKMGGQLYLNDSIQSSTAFNLNIPKDAQWLRAQAKVRQPIREDVLWSMPQFIIAYYRSDTIFKSNFIRVSRKITDDQAVSVFTDSKIPPDFEEVRLYFWNAGSKRELFVTDLKVLAF